MFATGFDALTGSLLLRLEIVGRNGVTPAEEWSGGSATYLGVMVSGPPNLSMIAGPGSPSLLSNVLLSTERSTGSPSCWGTSGQPATTVVEPTEDAERSPPGDAPA